MALLDSQGGSKMIIPVRCFSCGNLIGDKWGNFARWVKEGEDSGIVLDSLGVNATVAAASSLSC